MKIQIEPHTLLRAIERGATEVEIIETINSGINILGKQGRLGKSKVFLFEKERNGKYFIEKKLEVYYLIENDVIITITVYVFYGKFQIMTIHYDSKTDLLYLRIAPEQQQVTNQRVTENIVLDIGADNKIVGIEIMEASRHVNLDKLMPVEYLKAI